MYSPGKEKKSLRVCLQLCRCGCIDYLTGGETYRWDFLMQKDCRENKSSEDCALWDGNLQGHYLTFESVNSANNNDATKPVTTGTSLIQSSPSGVGYEEVGFDLRLNLDKLMWAPPGLTIEEVRLIHLVKYCSIYCRKLKFLGEGRTFLIENP